MFLFRRVSYKALCGLKIDIQKVQLLIKLEFLGGLIVHLPDDRRRKITIEFRVQIRVVMRKLRLYGVKLHELSRFFQGHAAPQSFVHSAVGFPSWQ